MLETDTFCFWFGGGGQFEITQVLENTEVCNLNNELENHELFFIVKELYRISVKPPLSPNTVYKDDHLGVL